MQNYICEGERIQVTAPSGGITSGNVVLVGAKVTVAITSAIEGEVAVCQTEGVFELPKATGAITKGDALYFDESENELTKTSTGNTLAGYAFTSALSGDATVQVAICCGINDVPTFTTAANVAAMTGTLTGTVNGAMVNVAATAASCGGGATPSSTDVDTAIATVVASIVTGVNEQNKELLTKLNAVIAALVAAGIMASE